MIMLQCGGRNEAEGFARSGPAQGVSGCPSKHERVYAFPVCLEMAPWFSTALKDVDWLVVDWRTNSALNGVMISKIY